MAPDLIHPDVTASTAEAVRCAAARSLVKSSTSDRNRARLPHQPLRLHRPSEARRVPGRISPRGQFSFRGNVHKHSRIDEEAVCQYRSVDRPPPIKSLAPSYGRLDHCENALELAAADNCAHLCFRLSRYPGWIAAQPRCRCSSTVS